MMGIPNPGIIAGPRSSIVGIHQYWRIRILSAQDRLYEAVTMEMAQSPAGSDICPGNTVIYDANWDSTGNVPENLIDGNSSTIGARVTDPVALVNGDIAWVGVDFTTPRRIREIRLKASSARPDRCPWAFLSQGSDDGVTWYTYGVHTKSSWTASESASFSVPETRWGAARSDAILWRVRWTENNGNTEFTSIRELEFRDSGGTDLATGGKAFQQASISVAENCTFAFDNNTGTNYTAGTAFTGGNRKPGVVGYLFPSGADPVTFAMTQEGGGAANRALQDFVVAWSVDADNWNAVLTVTGATGWGVLETRTWSI